MSAYLKTLACPIIILSTVILFDTQAFAGGSSLLKCASADGRVRFQNTVMWSGTMGGEGVWTIDGTEYTYRVTAHGDMKTSEDYIIAKWQEKTKVVLATNTVTTRNSTSIHEEYVMQLSLQSVDGTLYDPDLAQDLWQGYVICQSDSQYSDDDKTVP